MDKRSKALNREGCIPTFLCEISPIISRIPANIRKNLSIYLRLPDEMGGHFIEFSLYKLLKIFDCRDNSGRINGQIFPYWL